MTPVPDPGPLGRGGADTTLTDGEVESICREALGSLSLGGKKVLALVPDQTRHAPIDLFFRILCQVLEPEVEALDFLIATGSHRPMAEDEIDRHLGRKTSLRSRVQVFNHAFDRPDMLAEIGTLSRGETAALTAGLFREELTVTVNRRILDYDHLLLVTPVVPHEAMGFSGGNKIFFPGISGLPLLETLHWLAAVLTNPAVNGVKDTATRKLIDRAATFIPVPRTCLAFAVNAENQIACLYAGTPEQAWSRATDVSARLHVRYVESPYRCILGVTPRIYEDLWVAGKAMYKLEPVVADGGELVIYAPQVRELSFVHGEAIRRIGYHVRDYFLGRWERFSREPRLILAHSSNVRGAGTFSEGREHPRIAVTLATGISAEVCRSVNLGYRDPASIDVARWQAGGGEADRVVTEAGQDLYRLRASSGAEGSNG